MDQAALNAAVTAAVTAALAAQVPPSPSPGNTRDLLRAIAAALNANANDPARITAMAQEFTNMADHMENGATLAAAYEARASGVTVEERLIAQLGRTITTAIASNRGRGRGGRGRGRGRAD